MSRKLMWAAFGVVPLAVALRFLAVGSVARFTVAAAALVPLAWVISKATEEAEKHTNPAIGALLNATFGNATELLIAFFAISEGAFEVVRGSLTGSVVSNLLLVLGLACLLGGRAPLDRRSTLPSVALVGFATALLLVPAWAHWDAGQRGEAIASSAVPVSATLVLAYLAYAAWDVRRQLREAGGSGEADWSLRRSLLALGAGVVATGVVSESATSSIAGFSDAVGLTEFFVAATLVALVGNAAEHGTAVIVAAKGNVELGVEVALRSSAQVAAILIPAVALLSWLVRPLPLAFHPVELVAIGGSAALAAAVVARAHASRRGGLALVAAYAVVVLAFLFTHGLR